MQSALAVEPAAALPAHKATLVLGTVLMKENRPLPAGKYSVTLQLQSKANGRGQLFWQESGVSPRFFRDRSKLLTLQANGKREAVRIEIESKKPILAIRFDPATAPGLIELFSVVISDSTGKTVFRYPAAP